MRLLFLTLLCATAVTVPAVAQGSAKSCEGPVRVLSRGDSLPAVVMRVIGPACPARGGGLIAAALLAARTSADTASLARITAPAFGLVDGEVFAAALEVAEDTAAAPTARIYALRTLLWTLRPGAIIDAGVLAGAAPVPCRVGEPAPNFAPVPGTPLPRAAAEAVRRMAERVVRDEREPPTVRYAARCTWLLSREDLPPFSS